MKKARGKRVKKARGKRVRCEERERRKYNEERNDSCFLVQNEIKGRSVAS